MNVILLSFGIFSQILSEIMDCMPLLSDYLLYLLPSVAAGFLACYLMTKLRNGGKAGKVILTVFLIVIFVRSVFMTVSAYTYGFGITILFAAITVGWCMAVIGAFGKLNVWWEKILYAVCGVLIAE